MTVWSSRFSAPPQVPSSVLPAAADNTGRDSSSISERNGLSENSSGCFLVDGCAYFQDLYDCLRMAKKQILITGWDLGSDVRLVSGQVKGDSDVPPIKLNEVLNRQLDTHTNLQVYILIWDAYPFFCQHRESKKKLRATYSHPRLHLEFTRRLPSFASFHQKIVVIDDELAYCGGIDLLSERMDSPDHSVSEQSTKTHAGNPFSDRPEKQKNWPIHDLQVRIEGSVVVELSKWVRMTWWQATRKQLPLLTRVTPTHRAESRSSMTNRESVIGHKGAVDRREELLRFSGVSVSISRTQALYHKISEKREVEHNLMELLREARQYVYIECQYLTASRIIQCLCDLLSQRLGPEIVVVTPRIYLGWWEARTLGALRNRAVRQLQAADRFHRFGIFYPSLVDPDRDVMVHSKLLLVDDRAACVGSANLTNRSMGLDSECNLTIRCSHLLPAGGAIKNLRIELLSEHLDRPREVVEELLTKNASMLNLIHECRNRARSLKPVSEIYEDRLSRWLIQRKWSDPGGEMRGERLFYSRGGVRWKHLRSILTAAFFLAAVVLVSQRLRGIDWAMVGEALSRYKSVDLLIPFALVIASYFVYHLYDQLAFRVFRFALPRLRIAAIAFVSYAFNLSLGALVGGFGFRYRLYSRFGLSPAMITKIIGFSIMTNWSGYVLLAGLVLSFHPPEIPASWQSVAHSLSHIGPILISLTVFYLAGGVIWRGRVWKIRDVEIRLPSVGLAMTQVVLSSVCWLAIAAIIFLLLGSRIPFVEVLGILLTSSLAGVLTHIPAGIGVLEAVFIAFLGHRLPSSDVMAALLVYRALYYLVPLSLAAITYFWLEIQARLHVGIGTKT